MTFRPASEKQIALIARLVEERDLNSDAHALAFVEKAREAVMAGTFSSRFASEIIDMLFGCARLSGARATTSATEPGFYVREGEVYKVQPSQNGNLYAKKMVLTEPDCGGCANGEPCEAECKWGLSWEYAPGVVRTLTPEMKMSAAQAAHLGHVTGACVFCSRTLTDERSIAVGYGPVCAENHALPWGETAAA